MRGGTENLAGITGFAAALRSVASEVVMPAQLLALRDAFEQRLCVDHPHCVIFGRDAERLPNTSLFALPDLSAEATVIALDLAGIAVSSGAACSSGKVRESHVLAAMGARSAIRGGAIRVSIGRTTQWAELEACLDALRHHVMRVSQRGAA